MPNHVLTEVIFRNVHAEKQDFILSLVRGPEGMIDFETLLPIPLNVWKGSAGTEHDRAFGKGNIALVWSRESWGTKWNAYGIDQGYQTICRTESDLILTFQTAWRTPYGWLLALWHRSDVPLEYTWLDEGRSNAFVGRFTSYDDDLRSQPWSETQADDATTRRMHKLLWGVEAFALEGKAHD